MPPMQPVMAVVQVATAIVALSAGAFDDDRRESELAGMDDYLAKPVFLRNLQFILEKWLVAKRAPGSG